MISDQNSPADDQGLGSRRGAEDEGSRGSPHQSSLAPPSEDGDVRCTAWLALARILFPGILLLLSCYLVSIVRLAILQDSIP
jgi:hypothetical protein